MKIHEFIPESRDYRDPDVAKKQDAEVQKRRLARAMANRQATFIGSNAATWDTKANKRARDLEARGISPMAIWRATGNWRGLEGEWRQELSDKGVTLKKTTGSGTLGDFIDHPEFFAAYPGIDKNLKVEFVDDLTKMIGMSASGAFLPSQNKVLVSKTFDGEKLPQEEMLSILAHEWQHSIQNDYEPDFAPGANTTMQGVRDLQRTVNNYPVRVLNYDNEKVNPFNRHGRYDNINAYADTGGEKMSRAVQDRFDYDDNERRDAYPGNHFYRQTVHIPGDKVPPNAHGKNIPVNQYSEPRDDTHSTVTRHLDGVFGNGSWHGKGNKSTTYVSKDGRYPHEKPGYYD